MWPAAGALALRGRWYSAGALTLVSMAACLLSGAPNVAPALLAGAATFAISFGRSRLAAERLGSFAAIVIMLAPIVALLTHFALGARTPEFARSLDVWGSIVANGGVRTLIGHGFGSALYGLFGGYLDPQTPRSLVFQIWFDLGALGAGAFAAMRHEGLPSGRRTAAGARALPFGRARLGSRHLPPWAGGGTVVGLHAGGARRDRLCRSSSGGSSAKSVRASPRLGIRTRKTADASPRAAQGDYSHRDRRLPFADRQCRADPSRGGGDRRGVPWRRARVLARAWGDFNARKRANAHFRAWRRRRAVRRERRAPARHRRRRRPADGHQHGRRDEPDRRRRAANGSTR